MTLSGAYGMLAWAVIFGSLLAFLPHGMARQKAALIGTGIAMIGIAPGLHGLFGAPSIPLLFLALWRQLSPLPSPLQLRPALVVLLFGLLFYPFCLGLGGFDPYRLGYQPWPLLAALMPIAAALWWRGQVAWLYMLAAALLAYALGFFGNLWDALIDPWLVLLAGWQLLRCRFKRS